MQGFNMGRYVPPDQEGVLSFNQASGKGHALGKRASKLKTQGILTVRFEMPFAVWCSSCPKPTIIGQGVRFNAEKKKVGNYHSTPIYAFRMKHTACGGWIEIRTDPKNTAYVVTEGGKQRDLGEDKVREGEEGVPILSAEERLKRREDAFAVLEDRVEDKTTEKDSRRRIAELYEARERDWSDPYEASRRVRRGFRAERKIRVREQEQAEQVKERMGLGLDLLPHTEEDKQRAALIEYGPLTTEQDDSLRAASRPLFAASTSDQTTSKTRAALKAETTRQSFQQSLQNGIRISMDAFGGRKQIPAEGPKLKTKSTQEKEAPRPAAQLVDYDSD